jgi:hypothetical protein
MLVSGLSTHLWQGVGNVSRCSDSTGRMGATPIHSVDGDLFRRRLSTRRGYIADAGKTGAVREFAPAVRKEETSLEASGDRDRGKHES